MQTEIEAKWLNIDKDAFRKVLVDAGAKLMVPERQIVRQVYDFPDGILGSIGGWVRVRNEGHVITMSYKQLNDRTLHGTKEVTVVVRDFDIACSFLESIGLESKSIQETKRESWKLDDVEIEIDTWPWIPSFVEIETNSEAALKQTAELLKLDFAMALHGSVEIAYQAVYDFTEQEIDSWKEIRFIDVPDWLSSKKLK